jgi:hypothetical protein
VAINSANAKLIQPTIGLAQRGQNTAYHLGSAFSQTIKKLKQEQTRQFCQAKQSTPIQCHFNS